MSESADVVAGDDVLASQYNNLRKDVLNTTSGHTHNGTDSRALAANAVVEATITNGAVTENKIGALAVVEGKLGALAVTNGKIGAGAITKDKMLTLLSNPTSANHMHVGVSSTFGSGASHDLLYVWQIYAGSDNILVTATDNVDGQVVAIAHANAAVSYAFMMFLIPAGRTVTVITSGTGTGEAYYKGYQIGT